MSLDTFQVLDAGTEFVAPERRAATISETLRDALRQPALRATPSRRQVPRQLRHFRVPTQIEFSPSGDRTELTLVCGDRPGLLAQVAVVLRTHGLRVHDARIATFGERVEDFFQLTDEADRPLSPELCEKVTAALRAVLDAQ